MQSFKDYLEERYINLLPGDEAEKQKHAGEVHALLQKSYASIGGLHGSGFESPDDMVKNVHMWKILKKEGQIKAVKMYKNHPEGGRKSVAIGTDGSREGKLGLVKMMHDDVSRGRSYSEVSGPALKVLKKHVGDVKPHAMTRDQVQALQKPGEQIRAPHADDPEMLTHPELKDHLYQREIGGEWHTKVMLGKPKQFIKPK